MKYMHVRTGNIYKLLHVANEVNSDKFPKMAVYQSNSTGEIYARHYQDFLNKFVEVAE